MRKKHESYTPQQIVEWLKENKFAVQSWIDGLAETLQYIALSDDCGYDDERKDAIFQVAGARELLQNLHYMIERCERNEEK